MARFSWQKLLVSLSPAPEQYTMEDHQQAESLQHSPNGTKDHPAAPPPSVSSYSAWRTAAHLYLPFVTVGLFMTLGSPFETTQANILCVVLSAIPTNWLASFFYPADRPEPTPRQAIRFSRKSDIYRAAILFTYRWLFGTPFNLSSSSSTSQPGTSSAPLSLRGLQGHNSGAASSSCI